MRHRITISKGPRGYRVALKTSEGKLLCGVFMDLGSKPESEEQRDALERAGLLAQAMVEAVREKLSAQVE